MLARFVEQGGDATTAASIRANWNPSWGPDPGRIDEGVAIPLSDDWSWVEAFRLDEKRRARLAKEGK